MKDEYIKDRYGRTAGVIRYYDNGDQAALSYPAMQILGYYRKNRNITTNFTGTILAYGNIVAALLFTKIN